MKVVLKEIKKNYDENTNLTFSSDRHEELLTKIEEKRNFEFNERLEITQGLIGGPDEAFTVQFENLHKFSEEEQKYFRMLHTNTGKYFTSATTQYILYLSSKYKIDIEKLPNIKGKLYPYKDKLDERRETKNGKKMWYHLWWERDETFFSQGEKIVWAKRTYGRNFTITDKSFYGTANLFYIKSNRVNLRYMSALLNSKMMYFFMHERLKHTGDLLQIDKNQFMKIPLYVPKNYMVFVDKVNEILRQKEVDFDSDTSAIEDEIDVMVYRLYGLTHDEVKIIDPDFPLSADDYEKTQ